MRNHMVTRQLHALSLSSPIPGREKVKRSRLGPQANSVLIQCWLRNSDLLLLRSVLGKKRKKGVVWTDRERCNQNLVTNDWGQQPASRDDLAPAMLVVFSSSDFIRCADPRLKNC